MRFALWLAAYLGLLLAIFVQSLGPAGIDALLKNPAHHEALTNEVRKVAQEIAADPKYADDEPLGPDDGARERFRQFARRELAGD